MHWADGVYLLKGGGYSPEGEPINNRFICYVRNEYRSAGMTISRRVREIYTGQWPYMSMAESANNYQHIYVGTEDFVSGMCLLNPSMTSKELLQVLGINYEFKE